MSNNNNNNDERFYLFITDMPHKDISDILWEGGRADCNQIFERNPASVHIELTNLCFLHVWLKRSGAFYNSKQKRENKVVDLNGDSICAYFKKERFM